MITDTSLVDGIPQEGTVLGDPGAKVTLLQYEDLQCPNCRQYTITPVPHRRGRVRSRRDGERSTSAASTFLGEDSTQALRAVLAAAKQERPGR